MQADRRIIGHGIVALLFAIVPSALWAAGLSIELNDYLNRRTEKLYFSPGYVRLENSRETSIVRSDKRTVFTLNPGNHTYVERSFDDIQSSDLIHRKYNSDQTSTGDGDYKVRILSVSEHAIKNRPYKVAIVKYIPSNSNRPITTVTAVAKEMGAILAPQFASSSPLCKIMSNYWSNDEIGLLKAGLIPIKSSKLFELRSLSQNQTFPTTEYIPEGYRKVNSGEYYREMGIQFISEGATSRKKQIP